MSKIIGITIDTKSEKTKDKVYYYRTNEDLKKGDTIRIKSPSGGNPTATVVDTSGVKKTTKNIKSLER